jgi:Flp pilus assembly pilin Flp
VAIAALTLLSAAITGQFGFITGAVGGGGSAWEDADERE